VLKLLGDYVHAAKNNMIMVERNRNIVMIGWKPLETTFVRLNTYGAYKQNQSAGCGGVIRGCEGEWLGGFAKGIRLCCALMARFGVC
jgi:hypothetical protein